MFDYQQVPTGRDGTSGPCQNLRARPVLWRMQEARRHQVEHAIREGDGKVVFLEAEAVGNPCPACVLSGVAKRDG